MIVGYARTSTSDQVAGYEDQIAHLTLLGVEKVLAEQASAVGERPQFDAVLEFVRDGDTLIVTRLDRLCRSTAHFCEVFDRFGAEGSQDPHPQPRDRHQDTVSKTPGSSAASACQQGSMQPISNVIGFRSSLVWTATQVMSESW